MISLYIIGLLAIGIYDVFKARTATVMTALIVWLILAKVLGL